MTNDYGALLKNLENLRMLCQLKPGPDVCTVPKLRISKRWLCGYVGYAVMYVPKRYVQ